MLILVLLLAKYITIIYALCSVRKKVRHLIKAIPKSFHSRVVTKISSCRVNTTSRRGIKQLGVSFGSIFALKVAGGKPRPPPLNESPAQSKFLPGLDVNNNWAVPN